MKKPSSLVKHYHILFLLLFIFSTDSISSNFDDSKISHIQYPGWFIETPFNDLAEVISKISTQKKKGLMVLFTTEGCSYCEQFIRVSLGDPEIASIVTTHFESVGFEIFDDTEMTTPGGETSSISKFASQQKVQFSPTLLFFDSEGKRILHLTGYPSPVKFTRALDYIISDQYQAVSYRQYLLDKKAEEEKNKSYPGIPQKLTEDPIFGKPPYALDRSRFPASQPLLVIFERRDCPACKDLHKEVLSRKDIRQTLSKFEVVRFDASDNKTKIVTPKGTRTTPGKWYDELKFTQTPAFLFIEESGNEVLSTDTLVLPQRMMNSLNYVLDKAYMKGWTYQRYARSRAIERLKKEQP